jgi:GDP-L-fucose synthase
MNKNSKIYVAGHTGLVGSSILNKLKTEGYDNLIVRRHRQLDLTDRNSVDAFFEQARPQYVFLAAAHVGGIFANETFPAQFIRDNLCIQTNVIDCAYKNGATKLLFLGSSCIYPKLAPQPIKEEYLLTGPLEPTNEWYAVAKIAGIKMCQAYRRQYGFNAISVMPTNLYGPGDNFDLATSHVIPALIRKFHLAKLAAAGDSDGIRKDEASFGPIPRDIKATLSASGKLGNQSLPLAGSGPSLSVLLWGSGTPRREFLHVDDLADACMFLMLNYDSEEIINVGVGKDLTIKELAETVRDVVGFKGRMAFDPSKPDGTPQKLLDISRIHSLGWNSGIGLSEGIRQTYAWYLNCSRSPRLATQPRSQ